MLNKGGETKGKWYSNTDSINTSRLNKAPSGKRESISNKVYLVWKEIPWRNTISFPGCCFPEYKVHIHLQSPFIKIMRSKIAQQHKHKQQERPKQDQDLFFQVFARCKCFIKLTKHGSFLVGIELSFSKGKNNFDHIRFSCPYTCFCIIYNRNEQTFGLRPVVSHICMDPSSPAVTKRCLLIRE